MMPVAVKQIYLDTRLGHESNEKPALCLRGTKHAHCVVIDFPVRVLRRPAKDFDTLRATPYLGSDYPVDRMVKHLKKAGKRNGITVAAAKLLALVERGATDINDTDLPTEEDDDMTTTEAGDGEGSALDATMTDLVSPKPKAAKTAKKKATKGKKSEKTKTSKGKTAKAPKASGEPKAKPASGDGLGREGTVTRVICECLVQGGSNEEAVKLARKKFPDKKIADNYGAWYRNKLVKQGTLKAAK